MKKEKILLIGMCILLLISGCNVENNELIEEKTTIMTIKGSGSMEPFLNKTVYPNIEIEVKDINLTQELIPGRIYIYDKGNNTTPVIHTLEIIGKDWKNETKYIFKGLNNKGFDFPITRDMITKELIAVYFFGK